MCFGGFLGWCGEQGRGIYVGGLTGFEGAAVVETRRLGRAKNVAREILEKILACWAGCGGIRNGCFDWIICRLGMRCVFEDGKWTSTRLRTLVR